MKHHEHIQAIREGRDYKSPALACNETIDGLVHSALVIRASEDGVLLTPEARTLDAIGVQVERELRNRKEMIEALADRLRVAEAELAQYKVLPRERLTISHKDQEQVIA